MSFILKKNQMILYSIIAFFFLTLAFVYFSHNNKIFSVGGDAFGSLTYYNNGLINADVHSAHAETFDKKTNDNIPNPILSIVSNAVRFISPSAAYYYNFFIYVGLITTFFCSLYVSFHILPEFEYTISFALICSISITFSCFLLQHLFAGHLGFIPVFLLLWFFSFYKLYQKQNCKIAFFLGIISGAGTVFNPYYGYFCLLFVFYIYGYIFFFDQKKCKSILFYSCLSGLAALVIVACCMYPVISKLLNPHGQPIGTGYNRPFNSVTGVLPWMYLLPPAGHLLSPQWYVDFYRKTMVLSNVPENSLYLTWFNIVFFFYGAKLCFFTESLTTLQRYWYRFSFGAAIYCFLISMPPFIPLGDGKRFYWISSYLFKIFPMFRIYNRMGFFVLIFVTIGALIGFYSFLQAHKKYGKKIILLALIVICFELMPAIPLLDIGKYPAVYDWLKKQQGDFIVYEIPEDDDHGRDDFVFYKYLYYQSIYRKKIFNRSPVDVDADFQNYHFYENMKKWNVKYIIQHKNLYDIGPIPLEQKNSVCLEVAKEKFNNGIPERLPKWYKIKKIIGDSIVYSLE